MPDVLSPTEFLAQTAPAPDINGLVADAAQRHGVDPDLIHSVITRESAGDPKATSPKGAQGLMQLMPSTARQMGVADPYDPGQNIDGGVKLLRQLLDKYGDTKKALAAYNAGESAVDRAGGVPDIPETQNYVRSVSNDYQARKKDPLDWSDRYNTPIPPDKQAAFDAWADQQKAKTGRDPRGDRYDYDVNGLFLSGQGTDERGHATDQFKKPNHPTFSDESIYNGKDGYTGGHWGDGTYTPSATNVLLHDPEELKKYFAENEPGTQLLKPGPIPQASTAVRKIPSPSEFIADPLNSAPQRAEDLPLPEHFEQSHQDFAQRLRATLQPTIDKTKAVLADPSTLFEKAPPVAERAKPLEDAAQKFSDTVSEHGLIRPLQDLLRPPTQYAEPVPTTTAGKVAQGVGEGVTRTAEGLTTPTNLALLAGTEGLGLLPKIGALLPKAVSAYFGAQMFKAAYDKIPEVKQSIDKGDVKGAAQAITEAAASGALGSLAAFHVMGGAPGVARETEAPAADAMPAAGEPTPASATKIPSPTDFLAEESGGSPATAAIPARAAAPAAISDSRAAAAPEAVEPAARAQSAAPSPSQFLEEQAADTEPSQTPTATQNAPSNEAAKEAVPAREPATAPAVGRDVAIAVPGEQTNYPANYVVRELADVQPSHNPQSFEANPAYEHTNDRDYSQASNAARVVKNASPEVFNPEFPTTESPTAEHGAPIIDQRGNVLGGNSRTMSLARVYARNGEDADAYREAVANKAQQFGLNPTDVQKFQQPVLLREVQGPVDAQKAITDFNKSAAADLTPEERAVSDGRRLSDKTIQEIAGRLQDQGEGGSLADALRGDDGAGLINHLVRDGVLTEQEKNGYIDDRGFLTPEAKGRIGKALVGRLFNTPSEFRETRPEMRGKLERIAPQVLRVEGRPGWSLTDQAREAVGMVEDARAHRVNLDDLARQDAIGGRRYSPEARQIAQVLQESPRNAEYAFRRYANDEALSRPGSQRSMFDPPTRAQAFVDAFGEEPQHVEAPEPPAKTVAAEDKPGVTLEAMRKAQLLRQEKPGVTLSAFSRAIGEQFPSLSKSELVKLFTTAGKFMSEETGTFNPSALRIDPAAMREAFKNSRAQDVVDSAKRLGMRIRQEGNGAGNHLMDMIERSELEGGVDAGRMFARWADAEPSKLSREQRFELTDALEGRTEPKDPRVQRAFEAARGITDEIAGEATARGVEIRTKNGKRPFMALENYFPHTQVGNADALEKGPIRKDVIENIVRQRVQTDAAAAGKMVDDWVSFLKNGKPVDSTLDYLVKTKQAPDRATALANLQRYRKNIDRQGNIEYSRDLNLPFYDPNPLRVLPRVISSSARRLNQIAQFGQEHEKINAEILKIAHFGGNADFVRKSVDRIIGQVQGGKTAEERIARFALALQTLKLPYVGLQHSMQGLNTLLAADMPTLAAGMAAAFGKAGKRFSIESGAGAEPAIRDALRQAGSGDKRWADAYLRATGLTTMMRFNRALAANTGAKWAKKNFALLQAGGRGAAIAKTRLENMGIDPQAALDRGALSARDFLRAAKSMSDFTMFRNRPQDLPDLFTGTPVGRVLTQFKHWGYQESTMVADQIKRDFKEGKGRGLRTLLILGTVFPAAGGVVSLVKDALNGKDREFDNGVDQYLYALMHSSALGMAGEALNSAGSHHTLEFLAGPTAGDVATLGDILTDSNKDAGEKFDALKKYAVQRFAGPARRLFDDQ